MTDAGCGTVTLDVEGIDITFDAPSLPIDQDKQVILVLICQPSDVYGVELHITDTPESITALDVVPGDL